MPTIKVEDRSNALREISTDGATTLMEAIRSAGFDDMLALCGGCCSCSTCHVYIDSRFLALLPPSEETEQDLLEGLETRRPNSRLACQIEITPDCDGMAVAIAPEA